MFTTATDPTRLWPDAARLAVTVSMQLKAGGQPISGAGGPITEPIRAGYPDLGQNSFCHPVGERSTGDEHSDGGEYRPEIGLSPVPQWMSIVAIAGASALSDEQSSSRRIGGSALGLALVDSRPKICSAEPDVAEMSAALSAPAGLPELVLAPATVAVIARRAFAVELPGEGQ